MPTRSVHIVKEPPAASSAGSARLTRTRSAIAKVITALMGMAAPGTAAFPLPSGLNPHHFTYPSAASHASHSSVVSPHYVICMRCQQRGALEGPSRREEGASTRAEPPTPLRRFANSSAVKWDAPVPPAHRAAVAEALSRLMAAGEGYCQEAADRLATPRLVALLAAVMGPTLATPADGRGAEAGGEGFGERAGGDAICMLTTPVCKALALRRALLTVMHCHNHPPGKKGKKSKSTKKASLSLDPGQLAAAVAATACLRLLTVHQREACFVLAHLGAAPWLVALCEVPALQLWRNCMVRAVCECEWVHGMCVRVCVRVWT